MKTKLFTFLILATLFSVACRATANLPSKPGPAKPIPATQTLVAAITDVPDNTVEITINDFKFDPDIVIIALGTTVTWTNQDSSNHSIVADGGSWKSESLAKNATFSFTFDESGTYNYICSIHPTMMGTIIVK